MTDQFPQCKFAGRVQRANELRFCREPVIGKGSTKTLLQCLQCPLAGTAGTSPPIFSEEKSVKPVRSGCGCQRRKEKLNQFLPVLKLGDKVEKIAEITGIKKLIEEKYNRTPERKDS